MKSLDPGLAAHLASGVTTLATCWRIQRTDGVAIGFTDHDRSLTFEGDMFEPMGGGDSAPVVSTSDLAIDNSEFAGAFTNDRLSAADLAAGRFDGASVEIWRVNWANTDERVLLKRATIGETVREGEAFRAELRGQSHELSHVVGRVYQRTCDAIVGDARCGVDLQDAAYRADGTVTEIIDDTAFTASGLSGFADNWFAHGVLTWGAGANAGVKAHVKASAAAPGGLTRIDLWLPPGVAPVIGDTFTVTAGCDRRETTCAAKFSNLMNFRGFHLMPGDDAALQYPIRTENNDGGKR